MFSIDYKYLIFYYSNKYNKKYINITITIKNVYAILFSMYCSFNVS